MKKLLSYTLLMMSMCIFTACPSDDDDENENSPSSKTSSKFTGLWKMTGIKSSGKTNGMDVSLLFYQEGKLRIGTKDYYWTYDENTRILSTTATVNGCNLQWEITLVADDSWAGIGLWDATRGAIVANRVASVGSFKADDNNYVMMFLENRIWQNDGNESLKISGDYNYRIKGSAILKFYGSSEKYIGHLKNWGQNDYAIGYDKKANLMSFFFVNEDSKYKYTTIKLHDPFSLKGSWLELTDDIKIDYMGNGKYKIAD